MNRHNCCPERDLKSAAKWGLIAWAIAMLVAIATFLPGEVYAQTQTDVPTVLAESGELNELERHLIEMFAPYLGVNRTALLTALGRPEVSDEMEQCVPSDHGGGEVCFTFERWFYLITEMPDHLLVFIVSQDNPTDGVEDSTVVGWLIREMGQSEREYFSYEPEPESEIDNPFRSTFQ